MLNVLAQDARIGPGSTRVTGTSHNAAIGGNHREAWVCFHRDVKATGAPLTVQKELMRHASIQTTMNICGKVMTDSKVVETVLNGSRTEEKPTISAIVVRIIGVD